MICFKVSEISAGFSKSFLIVKDISKYAVYTAKTALSACSISLPPIVLCGPTICAFLFTAAQAF